MFVCNFKINKNGFMKIFMIVVAILAILILVLAIYTIFKESGKDNVEKNSQNNHIELNSGNYTNFLKDSHEDINRYLGTEVEVTGYVYRMNDFNDSQFVLARTMLINANTQAVVVGILCECSEAKKFDSYSWVTIEGIVEMGNYHGEIPIIRVTKIKEAKVPEEEFVYEPID